MAKTQTQTTAPKPTPSTSSLPTRRGRLQHTCVPLLCFPTASSSSYRSIAMLSLTDENTKACWGHWVSQPKPVFTSSKCRIFSTAVCSWAPALGSTEGKEGILTGAEEKRGKALAKNEESEKQKQSLERHIKICSLLVTILPNCDWWLPMGIGLCSVVNKSLSQIRCDGKHLPGDAVLVLNELAPCPAGKYIRL